MTPEQHAELNARLSELQTAKEITAFMDDVARRFGDDDPLVNGLGEQAAMMKLALRQQHCRRP